MIEIPEKLGSTAAQWRILRSTRQVGLMVMLAFGLMLVVCTVDKSAIVTFLEASRYQGNRVLPTTITTNSDFPPNTHRQNSSNTHDSDYTVFIPPPNNTKSTSTVHDHGVSRWVTVELEGNYTSSLYGHWTEPGGTPCKESKTADIRISGFDQNPATSLPSGEANEVFFQALDENGDSRCLGGDFFEIDLSGDRWKSRPPMKDYGNGTYSFTLQIHPDFAGEYNLTIILLFRHYEGLKFSPTRFVVDKQLRKLPIIFTRQRSELPTLPACQRYDFNRTLWSGRWTRHARNDSCPISNDGRYRCLPADFQCPSPWCSGSLGSLESNGWVYSAHCGFKLFSQSEAWECLNNKWLFWWGDSNHVDTIRNLLFFFLGVPDLEVVTRRFDKNFTNPQNGSKTIRITNIFNGHWDDKSNYEGLNSLANEEYRDLLRSYFNGSVAPDVVIFNSGLHDGVKWPNLRRYVGGVEFAASFWSEAVRAAALKPMFLFRSTVATGGYARSLAFNPNKVEAYNGVLLDKLMQKGLVDAVVDDFDMTWAWHFDNRCNDGVHYGRFPAKLKWRDGQIGHQYFVDLMLGHVLLNAICTR